MIPAKLKLMLLASMFQRNQRIVKGALGLLFAKSISLATIIFTVPLTLHHLGPERFGVWMTLTSLASVLGTADLGIGSGIMTELAKESGRGDATRLSEVLTNGLTALFAMATICSTIFLIVYFYFDLVSGLGLDAASTTETKSALLIFFLCSFVSIPAMLGQRVMIGLQMGWWSGLWASAGSCSALIALFVAVGLGASLPGMVFAFVGIPVIVLIMGSIWAIRSNTELRIKASLVARREVMRIVSHGGRFFAITIVYAVTFTTDNIIIARMMGPEAVALYSISDRLFQVIAVGLTMVNAPLWPAYAEAYAKGDAAWVAATFRKSLILNLVLGGGAAVILVAISGWIYPLWLGSAVMPPLALLTAIAIRRLMEALYNACNNLMNALSMVPLQLAFGAVMVATMLLLRGNFISWYGLVGAPLAVAAAVALFGLAPALIALRRIRVRMGA